MLSSVFIFRENDVYDDIDAASGTSFFPPKLNVLLFNASWSSIKKKGYFMCNYYSKWIQIWWIYCVFVCLMADIYDNDDSWPAWRWCVSSK